MLSKFTNPNRSRPALLAALLASLALAPAAAVERAAPASRAQLQLSFAPVVRQAAPAVVNIFSRKVVRAPGPSPFLSDPFFRRFFGERSPFGAPRERVQSSLGSGVIVGADGLIVTNAHVISGADQITVVLSDRREFDARLMMADSRTDLAVLRISVGDEKLPYLAFADSDTLEVGDIVLAIGNPFGVGQTVTSGIVSALARTVVGVTDIQSFIQTDAAINPGNSGGALVTLDGKLAGVNTAIFSKSGGSVGIGFAIPANMVAAVVAGVGRDGRLVRPWIGAGGQAVTSEIAASLGLDRPGGVLINAVRRRGPAAQAGVRVGDVVIAVDGRAVDDLQALRFRIATRAVGGEARLTVLRKGRRVEITIALVAPPEEPPRDQRTLPGGSPFAGATVVNLSPAVAEELSLDFDLGGVMVINVAPGSPADRLGLRPGDMILAVNDREVATTKGLAAALRVKARQWRIVIRRGGRTMLVTVHA